MFARFWSKIKDEMIFRRGVAHFLLISSLAVSLGLVGIDPLLLGASAAAVEPSRATTSLCCCGTVEGQCCGKACCGAVPAEDAPRPCSNDQGRPCLPDPLLAMQMADAFAVQHAGRHLPAFLVPPDRLPATPTLQADRVRLQI